MLNDALSLSLSLSLFCEASFLASLYPEKSEEPQFLLLAMLATVQRNSTEMSVPYASGPENTQNFLNVSKNHEGTSRKGVVQNDSWISGRANSRQTYVTNPHQGA